MLCDEDKALIRDRLKALGAQMPEFRSRPGQRVMIAEVAQALACAPAKPEGEGSQPAPLPEDGSNIVVVNGGTGIGKSLGYTLPAFVMAQRKRLKLVIASSTVALQEQLFGRDLPRFFKAWQLTPKIELAKGRTRYVCPYRLQQAVEDLRQIQMFTADTRARAVEDREDAAARQTVGEMAARLHDGQWNGDRDLWETPVEERLWQALTTDRNGCLGRTCAHYRGCPQVEARRRIKEADIVVANHDLVLADLSNKGKLIGAPGECLYVFDEAHHLPDKAIAAFASGHLLGASRRQLDRLAKLATSIAQVVPPADRENLRAMRADAQALEEKLDDLQRFLASLQSLVPSDRIPRPTLEFQMSALPEEIEQTGISVLTLTGALGDQTATALDALARALTADRARQPLIEKLIADLGFHVGHLDEIRTTWELLMKAPSESAPPIAKWVEIWVPRQGGTANMSALDFHVQASPVVAGGYLRALLWSKAAGVVLTSATIASLGSFDDFRARAGLARLPQLRCVDLPSPFDYANQAVLEIVALKASPKLVEAHTDEIVPLIESYVASERAEGTLVLFTSRRQMEAVAGRLPTHLRDRVQVQGVRPKGQLVQEHRSRIDRGEPATIFGLDSFAEGVDLAGRYCTHVVITKLPFAVPDHPVINALSAWIERRGGNPFLEIWVPDTARKLEQRVGRLIRSEADTGRVTVLDTRLWNTRYGKQILMGLPPFRLVALGRDVALRPS